MAYNAEYYREWIQRPGVAESRRAYQRRYRAEVTKKRNKAIINEAKNRPCAQCQQSFPVVCMDFHHRDPSTKSFSIGQAMNRSARQLREEIAKCDVLCANCHRIAEYGEQAA